MLSAFDTPYNIPSPEPIYAGSYVELPFHIQNPYSDMDVDLTNTANIVFSMALFGTFSNNNDNAIVLKITRNDMIGNMRKIEIDETHKNFLIVRLFSDDTINFEDAWYDFQIMLYDVDGIRNSTIGRGKVRVFKNINIIG